MPGRDERTVRSADPGATSSMASVRSRTFPSPPARSSQHLGSEVPVLLGGIRSEFDVAGTASLSTAIRGGMRAPTGGTRPRTGLLPPYGWGGAEFFGG